MDECSFSEFLCQHECVNQPGTYFCSCPPGYILLDDNRSCQDINECEHRNHTCNLQQTCYNLQGGFKCIDPIRCEEPYLRISDNRCMCPAENPGCRDQPFTILYRDMDVVSGRSVPADIFQMQATTRYPGAYYIFQIKSGNEGREFYMRCEFGHLSEKQIPELSQILYKGLSGCQHQLLAFSIPHYGMGSSGLSSLDFSRRESGQKKEQGHGVQTVPKLTYSMTHVDQVAGPVKADLLQRGCLPQGQEDIQLVGCLQPTPTVVGSAGVQSFVCIPPSPAHTQHHCV
ncbi:hypothetical protein P7K49_018485 [Saguinus oedipus]|uniref:EGF-like domain-containing protein n=1 Tax=Saguinus oedipus TaxID=9490 RepID=A0ABQ9V5I0_SAGOE|nr:hypothetical protein P7K49_018485 [Saguinus oedipus]